MFRRCMLLMMAILLIGWGRPALALDQAEIYQAAQVELARYLGGESMGMTLDELCGLFESLGRYQKSPSFLYYASLLRDAEAERFDQLDVYVLLLETDTDFDSLLQEADFPTVAETEAYARGRMAEAAHDNKGAIAYYQQCGAMLDSLARMRTLLLATPAPTETTVPTVTPATTVPTLIPTQTPAPTMQPERVNVAAGDYLISTYGNGTCVITDYTGNARTLDLPQEIKGYRVTGIGIGAFNDCEVLTSITIPDSVVTIEGSAFSQCGSLTSITLPPGVTAVGNRTFQNCYSLTRVVLPAGVTSIEEGSFYGCNALADIAIPADVVYIGDRAFDCCYNLKSMVIPDKVTFIGEEAFNWCIFLKDITLPASVTYIGEEAFRDCESLTLRVPQGSYAHQYAIDNNIPYTIY